MGRRGLRRGAGAYAGRRGRPLGHPTGRGGARQGWADDRRGGDDRRPYGCQDAAGIPGYGHCFWAKWSEGSPLGVGFYL